MASILLHRVMGHGTLPFSERTRPWAGSTATLVAVMLVLAVLPSAAMVSSPMSAAILEASLREARLVHVQRERPNPSRGGTAERESWRSSEVKARPADPVRVVGAGVDHTTNQRATFPVHHERPGGVERGAMIRAGLMVLPPPTRA